MKTIYSSVIGVAVVLLSSIGAQAATVSLVPNTTVVENGDALSVDLLLNAPDAPGELPGAFQGTVFLTYDPTLAMFDSFAFSDPAGPFDIGNPVTLDTGTVEVEFRNALNIGTIGTFTFNVLGMDGDVIDLTVRDGDDFFGSIVNTVPSNQPVAAAFEGTTVNVVPIPAAVWLFMSALGLAAGVARRR